MLIILIYAIEIGSNIHPVVFDTTIQTDMGIIDLMIVSSCSNPEASLSGLMKYHNDALSSTRMKPAIEVMYTAHTSRILRLITYNAT